MNLHKKWLFFAFNRHGLYRMVTCQNILISDGDWSRTSTAKQLEANEPTQKVAVLLLLFFAFNRHSLYKIVTCQNILI